MTHSARRLVLASASVTEKWLLDCVSLKCSIAKGDCPRQYTATKPVNRQADCRQLSQYMKAGTSSGASLGDKVEDIWKCKAGAGCKENHLKRQQEDEALEECKVEAKRLKRSNGTVTHLWSA